MQNLSKALLALALAAGLEHCAVPQYVPPPNYVNSGSYAYNGNVPAVTNPIPYGAIVPTWLGQPILHLRAVPGDGQFTAASAAGIRANLGMIAADHTPTAAETTVPTNPSRASGTASNGQRTDANGTILSELVNQNDRLTVVEDRLHITPPNPTAH